MGACCFQSDGGLMCLEFNFRGLMSWQGLKDALPSGVLMSDRSDWSDQKIYHMLQQLHGRLISALYGWKWLGEIEKN